MNKPQSWEARADEYSLYGFTDLPSVHKRGAVVLTHGEGPYVVDVNGRRYLDANSGLWNMVAGFDHKGLAQAAKDHAKPKATEDLADLVESLAASAP